MEPDIEQIAEGALREAFIQTRLSGRDVLVAENDQVVILRPSGEKTILHPVQHRRRRVIVGRPVKVQ